MQDFATWYAKRNLGKSVASLPTNTIAGSGESGKSTIVKQMKIIHQGGYGIDEMRMYRLTIFKNLIDCAKALIAAMRQFDIQPEHPRDCDFLMDYNLDPDPNAVLEPAVAEAVKNLWKDPCIPKVMEHQHEFYFMDSAP